MTTKPTFTPESWERKDLESITLELYEVVRVLVEVAGTNGHWGQDINDAEAALAKARGEG